MVGQRPTLPSTCWVGRSRSMTATVGAEVHIAVDVDSLKTQHLRLVKKLEGHHGYHGIAGDFPALAKVLYAAKRFGERRLRVGRSNACRGRRCSGSWSGSCSPSPPIVHRYGTWRTCSSKSRLRELCLAGSVGPGEPRSPGYPTVEGDVRRRLTVDLDVDPGSTSSTARRCAPARGAAGPAGGGRIPVGPIVHWLNGDR